MAKLKFDISCPNFDSYFSKSIESIGDQERASLPKELAFKLWRKGGIVDATSSNKLGFLAKVFVLWKVLKKRWVIIFEDEAGMNEEQYFQFKANLKKREYGMVPSEDLVSTGSFVLGSKELFETFSRLNFLSVGPAYSFLVKTKNTEVSKSIEYTQQMTYLFRMLSWYESKKKRWVMDTGLSMPEYLVLIFIYERGDVVSSQIHKEIYKYAYNSSSTQIKLAFGTLQRKGMLEKYGVKKGVNIRITALGIDILHRIADKYIINF